MTPESLVDYKTTFNSPTSYRFFLTQKLVRRCRNILSNITSSVQVGKDLFKRFNTEQGFRKGAIPSTSSASLVNHSIKMSSCLSMPKISKSLDVPSSRCGVLDHRLQPKTIRSKLEANCFSLALPNQHKQCQSQDKRCQKLFLWFQ